MAQSSWPSPAASRVVNDLQYERLVGPQHVDGLIGNPSDPALVYADGSGRQVSIRAGRYAQVRGHGWTSGSPDIVLAVGANSSGATRTDLVVLGLDRSTWDVTVYVKAGTPGAGPPALQVDTGDTGKYEIPLAEVTVPSGAAVISSGQVKIRHWYARPDGAASSGVNTRPVNVPDGSFLAEAGVKYVWNGSTWIDISSQPAQPPRVRVRRSSNFEIPHSASTVIPFETVRWDSKGMWSAGNPTRLTVPSGWGGLWSMGGCVEYAGNAANDRQTGIRVNGSLIVRSTTRPQVTSSQTAKVPVSTEWVMSPGDYIELEAWQNSGAPLDAVTSGLAPELWAHWVSA